MKPSSFVTDRSFADLLDEESVGWDVSPEKKRWQELASKDMPTLKSRFDEQYLVPEDTNASHLHDFFAYQAKYIKDPKKRPKFAGSRAAMRTRLLIMQAGMQAVSARAIDYYLADTLLSRLRTVVSGMPSSVEAVMADWPNIDYQSIETYLYRLPKVSAVLDFTNDDWPGAGASKDSDDNIRIHMPMKWITAPLADAFTTVVRLEAVKSRNPFPAFAATLSKFINYANSHVITEDDAVKLVRHVPELAGVESVEDIPSTYMDRVRRERGYAFNGNNLRRAALIIGFLEAAGTRKIPYREVNRLGGAGMRKGVNDFERIVEWAKANRKKVGKEGYFPKGNYLAMGAFKGLQPMEALYKSFDAIELFMSVMPESLVQKVKGISPLDRGVNWSIDSRISACIMVPKSLVQYICQEEEPRLESVSRWASDGYDYMLEAANAPGPHPDTIKQIKKTQDIIKAVPATSDDGLAVDDIGWLRYLPDVSVDEFERIDKEISDLAEITVGGVDMYDPELVSKLNILPSSAGFTPKNVYDSLNEDEQAAVREAFERTNENIGLENMDSEPKDPPRNHVIYTNWNLGAVTWTDKVGDIKVSNIINWRPASARHLMRFIKNRDFSALGYGGSSYPASLKYMCEKYSLSTLISDYVQPEDLSIFLPADKRSGQDVDRGDGQSLITVTPGTVVGAPGVGVSIDQLYKVSVDQLGLALSKIREHLVSLKTSLLSSREAASSWEDPEDDRYDARTLIAAIDEAISGQRGAWSSMFELDVPGTNKTIPSPFRFVKRIIDNIHEAASGDYHRLMGGEKAFFDGALSGHIGITIALAKYTSLKEIIEEDKDERSNYENQHELDPDIGIEPIPNIGKDAYLLPHEAKYDQRFSKDPHKQVMAVDPGGGKTLMCSTQRGIRTLAKGGKVLIVCPNSLITNYIEDVALITDGQINVIAIDLDVYKRYLKEGRIKELHKILHKSPPNTLFVLGMDSLKAGEMTTFYYSGVSMKRSDVIELVRTVDWKIIIIDENHKVRNQATTTYKNVASMFRGEPQIIQATGTYITDTIKDIYKQGSLLEPGIFGSEAKFDADFYQPVGKIRLPRDGAEAEAMRRLEDVADVVQIRRVEWAAWLPERVDEFEPCDDLSEAQRAAYESIFVAVAGPRPEDNDKPEDDDDDLDDVGGTRADADQVLGYSLSRLERFLTAMDLDEDLPKDLRLKGADKISPKIRKIIEILERHFSEEDAGKVLIFTQWLDAAQSIYDHIKDKFRNEEGNSRVMHYIAKQKKQLIPIIKSPKSGKDIIVGVQRSIQEGQNFQVASRVIMVETPWSPGDINQVEARIFRPDPKSTAKKRDNVYFTTLLIDETIDMTKASRLVAKRLSAARGNNKDNPEYRSINKNFGVIKMSRRTLWDVNSWYDVPKVPSIMRDDDEMREQSTYFNLATYLSYVGINAPGKEPIRNNLLEIERREMEEIRKLGKGENVPIPSGGTIRGSQLSASVPYIQNMRLPLESDLGLVNIATWASEEYAKSDKDLDPEEMKGYYVHTEFGDGVIVRYNRGGESQPATMQVQLNDVNQKTGKYRVVKVNANASFLIYDLELLEGKSVREKMAEMIGMRLAAGGDPALRKSAADIGEDDEIEDIEFEPVNDDDPEDPYYEPELEEPEEPEAEIDEELLPDENAPNGYWRDPNSGKRFIIFNLKAEVAIVNGMFAIITYAQPDGSPQFDELSDTTAVIQSYIYADISTYQRYESMYEALWDAHEKGRVKLTKNTLDMLNDLDSLFKLSRDSSRWIWNVPAAEKNLTRQFHLDSKRKTRGKAVEIWPIIWRHYDAGEGKVKVRALLAANEGNNPLASRLLRIRKGQARFKRDPTGFHISFYQNKRDAVRDLKDLDSADNINIVNLKEVLETVGDLNVRGRARK